MEQPITVRQSTRFFGLIIIWPLCFLWYLRDLLLTQHPQVSLDLAIFLACVICLMLHVFLIRRPRLILKNDMLCYRSMFSGWSLAKYRISSASVQPGRGGNTIVLSDRTSGRGYAFPERLFHEAGVEDWFAELPAAVTTPLSAGKNRAPR